MDTLDPEAEARVRNGFAGQQFMNTLGAQLTAVAPGSVTIACPYDTRLLQQHGYVHAGVLATLADTASGFAALTLTRPGQDILTADFTIHLLRPATGTSYVASATVLRAGRTLTICRAEVDSDALCAVATVTLSVRQATPETEH